jgi:hypothetical protein
MPAWVALVLQYGLMYGPDAAKAVKAILTKPDPSEADWDALFAVATKQTYDDYIAAAKAKAGLP